MVLHRHAHTVLCRHAHVLPQCRIGVLDIMPVLCKLAGSCLFDIHYTFSTPLNLTAPSTTVSDCLTACICCSATGAVAAFRAALMRGSK